MSEMSYTFFTHSVWDKSEFWSQTVISNTCINPFYASDCSQGIEVKFKIQQKQGTQGYAGQESFSGILWHFGSR